MSDRLNAIERAFALLGIAPSGDQKVLFPDGDAGGGADRFAGFEGRFDGLADSLGGSVDAYRASSGAEQERTVRGGAPGV